MFNLKIIKMTATIKSFIMAAILLPIASVNCQAQDWPQWRGLNRDAKVAGFSAPTAWPAQLNPTWKVVVGTGDATPALVDGKIYAFGRIGENEVLQCIDASTGKQLWQAEGYPSATITGAAASHPGPRSSVSVAEGKIATVGAWGDIACYDASNGRLLWRNEDYKGQVPAFHTGMSPLIDAGVCYAHLGGPENGTFLAFELATGKIKWKVEGEAPAYS